MTTGVIPFTQDGEKVTVYYEVTDGKVKATGVGFNLVRTDELLEAIKRDIAYQKAKHESQ